jgi:peptide deformylase
MAVHRVLTLDELDRSEPARACGTVDERLRRLATDLLDTMRASPACVGLAAPQIGVPLRAFVLDVSGHRATSRHHGRLVVFDPVIGERRGAQTAREGCMSVPHLTGDVVRATEVVLTGAGLDGEALELHAEGFEARAIQHEVDHLDGLVFLDRLRGPGALHVRKVYR